MKRSISALYTAIMIICVLSGCNDTKEVNEKNHKASTSDIDTKQDESNIESDEENEKMVYLETSSTRYESGYSLVYSV